MFNVVIERIRKLASRHIFIYVVIFLILIAFGNASLIYKNINLAVLNRLRPDTFDYLIDVRQRTEAVDQFRLGEYLRYYQKVAGVFPEMSDAHALSGYCLFYQGKVIEAENAYHKAIKKNPHFSGYYYNLGVIAFEDGRYDHARQFFKEAISIDIHQNILFVAQSKRLLVPLVVLVSADPQNYLVNYYQSLYKEAGINWAGSQFYGKHFQDALQNSLGLIKAGVVDPDLYFYAGASATELNLFEQAIVLLSKSLDITKTDKTTIEYMIKAIDQQIAKHPESSNSLSAQRSMLNQLLTKSSSRTRPAKLSLF